MVNFFSKKNYGRNVTINEESFRVLTNDLFVPELDDVDVNELFFEQHP